MGEPFDDDTPTPRARPGQSEPTPTGLRRRHMSDTERAEVGLAHRRAEAEAAAARRANELAIPADEPHEITSPVDLIDRELSQSEIEVVRQSRRDSDDPATVGDIAKLAERMIARERAELANRQLARANRTPSEELLAEVAALRIDVGEIMRWWKPIRAVMVFLAIAGFGAVGFFVDQLLVHAEAKTEAAIKIDHIERALVDLRQDIRDLRDDHASRHYSSPSSQPAPKDPSP